MRTIPDNNLAYPILIKLSSGASGSGFLLNTGVDIYFITAKHVLFQKSGTLRAETATLICQSKDLDDDSTTNFSVNLRDLHLKSLILKHATKDVAAFKLGPVTKREDGTFTIHLVPEIIISLQGNIDIVSVSIKNVVQISKVLISNDIIVYGYPSSLGLKNSPQIDYTKPLLRKGIIANINKPNGTIILDCPVYPGNSGGPAIQLRRVENGIAHEVIGVVSQYIPYARNLADQLTGLIISDLANSGYSVVVAMDYVYELIGFLPNDIAIK